MVPGACPFNMPAYELVIDPEYWTNTKHKTKIGCTAHLKYLLLCLPSLAITILITCTMLMQVNHNKQTNSEFKLKHK